MLNIFNISKKQKYERIIAYFNYKKEYYNNLYIASSYQDKNCEYYLAMKTAYNDIVTYLKNNLK